MCARTYRRLIRARSPLARPLRNASSGFADNQSYGLGGNGMTEGQKSNIIFGSLFAGFMLLMSGYLIT